MILHGNEIILPLKQANLNTEFQFDWVPRTVYTGNICIYPKNAIYSDTIGAFQNIYYNATHNTYSDLPDLWSGQKDANRIFAARQYYDPVDHGSDWRHRVWRTHTAVRDAADYPSNPFSCVTANMWRMRLEDYAYEPEDPDYPAWQPRPYQYQDVYWVCNTDTSKSITVTGVTAWAVLLFFDLANLTTAIENGVKKIGFTFLQGYRLSNNMSRANIGIVDPVPWSGTPTGHTTHYGFGDGWQPSVSLNSVSILKDFTRNGTRNTIVALKGKITWLDESLTTGIMSQPYLNFGHGDTPKDGKLLMLGAEYHGTLNLV